MKDLTSSPTPLVIRRSTRPTRRDRNAGDRAPPGRVLVTPVHREHVEETRQLTATLLGAAASAFGAREDEERSARGDSATRPVRGAAPRARRVIRDMRTEGVTGVATASRIDDEKVGG